MIRPAYVCGVSGCDTHSDDYWPMAECRCCGDDVCEAHIQAGTKRDADLDQRESGICTDCWPKFYLTDKEEEESEKADHQDREAQ